MARIKIGNFGQQVRGAVRQAQPDLPRSGDPLAQGLVQASATLLEADIRKRREADLEAKRAFEQAERERAQNEERARRNNMAATFARYQVNAELLASGIGNRLTEGVVTREQAQKELDEGIADLRKKLLDPLPETSRADLADNLVTFDGRARMKFTEALQQHARLERVAGFQSTLEEYQRLALTDRARAIGQARVLIEGEGVALLGAAEAQKVFQRFREGAVYVDLDRRITAAQENAGALRVLQQELAGEQSNDLAPERRRFLEGNIQTYLGRIEHRAERERDKRMAALERQGRRLSWYVENGHTIPAKEFTHFVAQAKGTEFEPFAQTLLDEQRSVRELGRMTPAAMMAKVKELESQYGPTPTREQLLHIDKIRRFADRSVKLLNESLLTFLNERDDAAVPMLDMTDVNSWGPALERRAAVVTEGSKKYGVAPRGLFPQEAAAFTQLLRNGSVKDQTQILATLRNGFADDNVYRATMQQIAPDEPVIAAAGLAAARGLDASTGQSLAALILRGQQLLRPNRKEDGTPAGGKGLPMPTDADLMKTWSTRARDAFSNNAEAGSLFFQTARAIYAAYADTAGDLSGVLDNSRWEQAIEVATGGIAKHNGRHIVLPHGVSQGDFRDSLRRRLEWSVAQGKVGEGWTVDKLMALPLQNSGDRRYIFRVGDAKLIGKDGRPLEIDFAQPTPFKPGGR